MMINSLKLAVILLFVCWLSACGGGGASQTETQPAPSPPPVLQPEAPFLPGQRSSLASFDSVNTDGQYPIRLYLPNDLDASRLYPVMYIFDAEWLFEDIANAVDELELQLILIGVENDTRGTPTYQHREVFATWPSAESYFHFIRDELDPWVTGNYPIDPENKSLIGHSYLGLFVAFALLLDDPDNPFFHSYVSLDATVVGNGEDLLAVLEQRGQLSPVMSIQAIFVGAGQSNAVSVNWFARQIQDVGFQGIDLHYLSYDVSHKDVITASINDVLTIRYVEGQ